MNDLLNLRPDEHTVTGVYTGEEGVGTEGITSDDVEMQRLVVVNAGSKWLKEYDGVEGQLMNTTTFECQERVLFVPLYYTRRWIRWPTSDDPEGTQRVISDKRINDPEAKETAIMLGWQLDGEGSRELVMVQMFGSSLSTARMMATVFSNETIANSTLKAPICYRTFILSTSVRTKGPDSWYAFSAKRHVLLDQICEHIGADVDEWYEEAAEINDEFGTSRYVEVTGANEQQALAAYADADALPPGSAVPQDGEEQYF